MKKQKHILLLLLILLLNLSPANATTQLKIKVNNKVISSDVEPFIKNGTTYVPIKFIGEALNADKIVWNEGAKTVLITKASTKIALIINKNYAYVDDVYTQLDANAIIVAGRTFVPLKFISRSFGADVDWNQSTYTVSINTKKSNTIANNNSSSNISSSSNGSSSSSNTSSNNSNTSSAGNNSSNNSSTNYYYTEDEVYWLSRIIEAEASGEPFKGKVAVGEVILNRVESNDFPNTIWTVIFDTNYGVQFEPVANGTIYNTPSEECIEAAIIALKGSNYAGDSLYFLNPSIAESKWIVSNRKFYATIANHDFYL